MDIIDTRDLQEELEELEQELEDLEEKVKEAKEEVDNAVQNDEDAGVIEDLEEIYNDAEKELGEWKDEYQERLDALKELKEEIYDFEDGVALIPEKDFEEFCQEELENLGYISRDAFFIVIDWKATADNMSMDYSEVEFDDETYLYRS